MNESEQHEDKIEKSLTPGRREEHKEISMFNRNSNYFNEESFCGSLGFNFNFGFTPNKKDEHLVSINSLNYMDINFQENRKEEEREKSEVYEVKAEKENSMKEMLGMKE